MTYVQGLTGTQEEYDEYGNKKSDERKALAVYVASVIGSGVGGALLWKRHPILGGLLGFFIAGPAIGTTVTAIYGGYKGLKF